MLQKRVLLSIIVLALATAAVYTPLVVLAGVAGIMGTVIVWRWPAAGIIAVLLATTLGEFARVTLGGIALTALDLATPAIVGIWFVRKIINREPWKLDRSGLWLLGFWCVATLSLLIGSGELTSGQTLTAALYLARFIVISSLYFVAQDFVNNNPSYSLSSLQSLQSFEKRRVFLANTLFVVGGILAISGFILLKLIPDFTAAGLAEVGWDPHIGRLTTAWLDPNFAGGGFAFILAFVGARALAEKQFSQKIVLGGLVLVLLVALLLTYSRSGLLALVIAGGMLGLVRSRTLLVAGVVLALVGVGISDRLQKRLGEFAQSIAAIGQDTQRVLDPTAALRVESWREGFRVWSEAPLLGVGFGAYGAHQQFVNQKSHASTGSDASLLNVGALTGIVGLGVFLAFLASIFGTAWARRDDPTALGFFAGGLGLLACAVFVNALFFPPLAVYFYVFAGVVGGRPSHP